MLYNPSLAKPPEKTDKTDRHRRDYTLRSGVKRVSEPRRTYTQQARGKSREQGRYHLPGQEENTYSYPTSGASASGRRERSSNGRPESYQQGANACSQIEDNGMSYNSISPR